MPEVELPNPEELEELRERSFTRRAALLTTVYAVTRGRSSTPRWPPLWSASRWG